MDNKFKGWKEQWANRKVYHYYRCPQCRQKLRVPRGRGRDVYKRQASSS